MLKQRIEEHATKIGETYGKHSNLTGKTPRNPKCWTTVKKGEEHTKKSRQSKNTWKNIWETYVNHSTVTGKTPETKKIRSWKSTKAKHTKWWTCNRNERQKIWIWPSRRNNKKFHLLYCENKRSEWKQKEMKIDRNKMLVYNTDSILCIVGRVAWWSKRRIILPSYLT